jgi:hypothetical protein
MKQFEVDDIKTIKSKLDILIEKFNQIDDARLINIDRHYNLTEFCKLVGLSKYQVNQDIKKGRLNPLKRAGRFYFSKEIINKYLKHNG